jgi:FKBP-type peptidyl-prolyl cis-trans isomerase SlyD
MKIQKDTVPTIMFELTVDGYDGELVENTEDDKPFEFLFGNGNLLPAFEAELLGLAAGDEFKFILPSAEAYGAFDENLLIRFDQKLFLDPDGNLMEDCALDNFMPMKDDEGNMLNGRVTELGEDYVELDFNHPLVGMDLYFTGQVVRVRKASEEELKRGDVEVHEHTLWDDSGDDDPVCNANG